MITQEYENFAVNDDVVIVGYNFRGKIVGIGYYPDDRRGQRLYGNNFDGIIYDIKLNDCQLIMHVFTQDLRKA